MNKIFQKKYLYFLILFFVFLFYFISKFSFKDGHPTCNNYVFNVYLYLSMSICLVGLFAYMLNELLWKNNDDKNSPMNLKEIISKLGGYYWLSLIASFILVIMIAFRALYSKEGHIVNHLLWILFILSISVMIYPSLKNEKTSENVDNALLSTSIIFILMSAIVYIYPSFFQKTYNFMIVGLMVGLIAIIIVELISYFLISNPETYKSWRKYITYFVIILFSLFVSYDTIGVFNEAKYCVNYPNYPKSSINFFLDILNLFSSLLNSYNN
jgi:FtsH-binding integral membrane protein